MARTRVTPGGPDPGPRVTAAANTIEVVDLTVRIGEVLALLGPSG